MSSGLERQLPNQAQYVRGSCTDKDWRSSKCPSFCVNPANNDKLDGGIGIRKCSGRDDDTYYCDNGADFDCDTLENVLSFQGTPTALTTIGIVPTSSSSPSSPSTAPTTASSSTATTTSSTELSEASNAAQSSATDGAESATSSDTPPSDSPSNGLIIGLAVGIPIGVLGLAAAAFMFFWSRRKLRGSGQSSVLQHPPLDERHMAGYPYTDRINGYYQKTPEPAEAWVPPHVVELRADAPPAHELPAAFR
ncbi:hypothetical protein MMYC01_204954 [Madurella mycetomatis]|uniref:Uncharacterized protein n=1 Tax=Madurella mycetomatis TaxID=100816 RepID=A0A175W501_9PEZI|nr:hypothetical protein MMYC01_204954 [Madurella mycetomatis]